MGFNYSDLEQVISAMERDKAAYFTRKVDNGTELICYSPYFTYDYKTNKETIHCYVYYWVDSFDANGKFVSHKPLEGFYSRTLDKNVSFN